jgi:hypothetical protein
LLAAVGAFGPTVEGEDLAFAADPPVDLMGVLKVLHTGVRALLAGRRWYGCDGATGCVAVLSPTAPIPSEITLLCVEGDRCWDRIDPAARIDRPGVFGQGTRPAGPSRPDPRVLPSREPSAG